MENPTVDGGKSYAEFGRCLKGWDAFERAAASNERHWFQDLLSLWCPSGYASNTHGLRLAIRNGYLNFYRLGQSVARVQCTSGELAAEVHYKYVLDEPLPGMSKSPYVRLNDKGVFFRDKPVATYKDISTLRRWIEKAGGKHAGAEKSIVDRLVEKNDHIIDLEMALPAWKRPKVAVRMDLVAIENETVVFWEVKTVDDSRLRCRAEFEEDKFPEVLKQLSHYRDYLRRESHSEQVESAYRCTAKILVKLRALADKIGPVSPLGASIIAASQIDTLAVAPRANLVVVDVESDHPERTAWTSWKRSHEGKLKDTPMLVLEAPELLKLKDAQ